MTNNAFLLRLCSVVCFALCAGNLSAADLVAYSEYLRPDPFGQIVASDRSGGDSHGERDAKTKVVELRAARNGYASFHLAVHMPNGGRYSLLLNLRDPSRRVQIDLFKTWFHFNVSDKKYYPDALIPVLNPYRSELPDLENQIKGQTDQVFWVDIWVPKEAAPGLYQGNAVLKSARSQSVLKIQLKVLQAIIPEEDALTIDHNSYGTSWLAELYPKVRHAHGQNFFDGDALFDLIHSYHRLFYEHHGTFHQLGYGHAGKVGPEFAPVLDGWGRNKHIISWDAFDRHYGPLFDGSAFAQTRRSPKPIPFVYLPINPEWPASFLWWGEPGYQAEFSNVVGEMERHFRQKGWVQTRFEMFFNQKKRYKGFPWDGDETRFSKDDTFFLEYGRLLKRALPAETPVKFIFRSDTSWRMEQQFQLLAGVVNFWVASGDILSWLPDALRKVKQRGDIVWIYSGPPPINAKSSAILENPLRAWIWNIDGYIHWLTVSPSSDPWFHSQGEETCLAYPGERFGLNGPIASIRLKIQRNFIQDINLLKLLEARYSPDNLRREVTARVNGTEPKDWWIPRPAMADLPAEEWSNSGIEEAVAPYRRPYQNWDPQFWLKTRDYILNLTEAISGTDTPIRERVKK